MNALCSKTVVCLLVSLVLVSCVGTPRPDRPTVHEARWTPPVERVTPDVGQRAALRTYLEAIPLVVIPETPIEPARLYIEHLVEQLGYRSTDERARHVRCVFSIEQIESDRNHYARAHLRCVLESTTVERTVSAELSGMSVFSSVSVYDAGMNSLLRIPDTELERVIGELVEAVIAEQERDGLEYRVEGVSHDDLTAVLETVSSPASAYDRRYAPYSPVDMQTVLKEILHGSPYDAEVHAATRTIVFFEREM